MSPNRPMINKTKHNEVYCMFRKIGNSFFFFILEFIITNYLISYPCKTLRMKSDTIISIYLKKKENIFDQIATTKFEKKNPN
jgi:hypothetical protein